MELQRIGLSAALLYLACCTLVHCDKTQVKTATVPVKYEGEQYLRENTSEWNITCTVLDKNWNGNFLWKRNGQQLVAETGSGDMSVNFPPINGDGHKSRVLQAHNLKPEYEGVYTCIDNGDSSFQMTIVYDVTVVVLAPKNDSVELECSQEQKWFKDDSPLNLTSDDSQQITLLKSENKLLISTVGNKKADEADPVYGTYSCKNETIAYQYRVVKQPRVKTEQYQNVVEEEKMHLACTVIVPEKPDSTLKLMWSFKGQNYSGSDEGARISLGSDSERHIKNAIFTLKDIQMDDRGEVVCLAYYNYVDLSVSPNKYGQDTTFIRVKDKYAALWPFLGICAEVVILCIIILIYEKKRNKSELEESDTDQSPDTKPTSNKDSDVRQRK